MPPEDELQTPVTEEPAAPEPDEPEAAAATAVAAPEADPEPAAETKYLTQEQFDREFARRLREDRAKRPTSDDSNPWLQFGRQIESHPDAESIRERVQSVLNDAYEVDPVAAAERAVQTAEQRMELRLAETELRGSDPDFKAHELEIKAYAEEHGYPVETAKHLRLVTSAWKGDNLTQLRAEAELEAQRRAQAQRQAKAGAVLPSGGTTKTPDADPRKMSDADFLKSEGLSLLRD